MMIEEKETTQQEIDDAGEKEASDPRKNHGMRKDYTLGDLSDHDKDMWEHAVNNHKVMAFEKESQAWGYAGRMFEKILGKCGIQIRGRGGRNVDKQLRKERVIVESRKYNSEDPDGYKTGKYIYKNNELAGFVSDPYLRSGRIIELAPTYLVKVFGDN